MTDPRVVFMGSPAPAVPVLAALQELDYEITAVYTAPDRPAGRGRRVQESPVKTAAVERGLPVHTPGRLRSAEERERFAALGADLVVVAAYGLLLPAAFLFEHAGGPRYGAVNVHPSLLPRWRGASPVASAILAGDTVTGTSLFMVDEGMDTGPLLVQREVPLHGDERTAELTDRLFRLGGELLREVLPLYVRGEIQPTPQPSEGVTHARRFTKEDAVLDWTVPAAELERRVRAFDSWPGSVTFWEGRRLEVLDAAVLEQQADAETGTVIAVNGGVAVATGDGLLALWRVKPEGRPAMDIGEFIRGRAGFVGAHLPS